MIKLFKNGVSCDNIIKFRKSVENLYGLKPLVNLINAYNTKKASVVVNKDKWKPEIATNGF